MRHSRRADVTYLNGLALEGIIATGLTRRRVVVKVVGDLIWEKARNARATPLDLDEFQRRSCRCDGACCGGCRAYTPGVRNRSSFRAHTLAPSFAAGASIRKDQDHSQRRPAAASGPDRAALRSDYRRPPGAMEGHCRTDRSRGQQRLEFADRRRRTAMPELTRQAVASRADVSFAGHVRPDRICEELRSAHLFVLNSSYEGLPHIVLEAKAAGVPVIATAAGGTGEIMHHDVDGWVVPVGGDESLTHAIRHLLSHADVRARLAEQGRRQVVADHSVRKLIRRHRSGARRRLTWPTEISRS